VTNVVITITMKNTIDQNKLIKKIEGYWKESSFVFEKILSDGSVFRREIPPKTNYPIPIPNVLTEEESQTIYRLIKEKEKGANCYGYMGISASRITGERLGNEEYESDEWIWPGDFAEHYVLTHKVRPTEEFLKWIGYVI
jgi:hypothetical protein